VFACHRARSIDEHGALDRPRLDQDEREALERRGRNEGLAARQRPPFLFLVYGAGDEDVGVRRRAIDDRTYKHKGQRPGTAPLVLGEEASESAAPFEVLDAADAEQIGPVTEAGGGPKPLGRPGAAVDAEADDGLRLVGDSKTVLDEP